MAREIEPLTTLKAFVARYPTQSAAAGALGIRPSYLSDLLLNRRTFSPMILNRLGLRRAVVSA